ncbi:ImmA/IrrE family metallo-endopeptidase [bacterium]|nr:ImmA/IrrE family metallo-endopeptidase [bacterium]
MRINVQPKMLTWARQRARLNINALLNRFPKFNEWEQGVIQPTLKQLEAFAQKTHLPLGTFFLQEPPKIEIPIPDFRTMVSGLYDQPTQDLLDIIYICQQRQEWYREYLRMQQPEELGFVGKTTIKNDVIEVAADIRKTINFNLDQRLQARTWTDALRLFIDQVEKQGILVMVSGVVGSNNYRKLDLEEFRGFVLVDKFASLIFINSNDTKSAKMFTLAHELAHIWLGESGISNIQAEHIPNEKTERWCNQVAAELLVPLEDLKKYYSADSKLNTEMERLARRYKVSTLVILRRIFDLGAINREDFWETWNIEFERLLKIERRSSDGGDFYRTLGVRISRRFASAVVSSTLEGQTLFRDAFKMLGIKKNSTFQEIVNKLGYIK